MATPKHPPGPPMTLGNARKAKIVETTGGRLTEWDKTFTVWDGSLFFSGRLCMRRNR